MRKLYATSDLLRVLLACKVLAAAAAAAGNGVIPCKSSSERSRKNENAVLYTKI